MSAATTRRIDQAFELAPLVATREQARPAEDARAEAALRGPITRAQLLALVAARDPGLAAQAHRVRAALHTARAEGALPPPEVDGQAWNLPLVRPYALGEADMYMVEVRQMFPAPGALDARARAQAEDARALVAALATREQDVGYRAAQAYADYVHGALDHRVHSAHLALLAEMHDAARARLAAGGATLADVARVEAEQARTLREIVRIDGDVARARAALNALLLREPDAPLGPPADLSPASVALPIEALRARALRARGMLREARSRIDAARARTDAARAEATWPAFTASLSYWQDPLRRPGVGASVGVTLPWLSAAPRERLAAARETEDAELAAARATAVDVEGELATALARLRALEREYGVLETASRPAALRAIDAVRDAYVAGHATLLEWLDATRTALDLEMDEATITADLAHAAADLERAVGEPLPRAPVAATDVGGTP